jgi:hypothetical protein
MRQFGLRVPLVQAGEAFNHLGNHRSGRALILPIVAPILERRDARRAV